MGFWAAIPILGKLIDSIGGAIDANVTSTLTVTPNSRPVSFGWASQNSCNSNPPLIRLISRGRKSMRAFYPHEYEERTGKRIKLTNFEPGSTT